MKVIITIETKENSFGFAQSFIDKISGEIKEFFKGSKINFNFSTEEIEENIYHD